MPYSAAKLQAKIEEAQLRTDLALTHLDKAGKTLAHTPSGSGENAIACVKAEIVFRLRFTNLCLFTIRYVRALVPWAAVNLSRVALQSGGAYLLALAFAAPGLASRQVSCIWVRACG